MRLRSFLLAWLAGGWLAGLGAAAMFGASAWAIAFAACAAPAALALLRKDRTLLLCALAFGAVFAGGVARELHRHDAPPADAVSHLNGRDLHLRGVVREDPDRGDTSQRFAVSVREALVDGAWQPASGGVLVRAGILPAYRAGDVVELEGTVDPPPVLEEFDYAAYLARKDIRSVAEYPQFRRIGRDEPGPLRALQLGVRRSLSRGLSVALPEPQASLAQGVLLGQRSALPDDVSDALNTTNTSHLVVVSGSNVVLVSAFFVTVLAWIVGRRPAGLLSIAAVLAYCSLIGFSPPVLRAFAMGVLLVIATATGRRTSGMTSILAAAALMAGLDPPILRDVSFQLSFSATAGIIYLSSPLRHALVQLTGAIIRRDDVPQWLGGAVLEPAAVTIAAIIATTPLLALNFERVSLVGLPANMLIVPFFSLILVTSLLAAIGGLLPYAHLAAAFPAYVAFSYWLIVTEWMAALPAAAATIDGFGARWALASYALIAVATPFAARALRRGDAQLAASLLIDRRSMRRFVMFAAPAAVLLATAGFAWWPSGPRRLEVTVIDVGQGDAILIETPAGHDVLIDGGPGPAVLRGLSAELPWRDRSLDLVILTHPQTDHFTGLVDVLARYDVRRVVSNGAVADGPASAAWRRAVRTEGRRIETARAGDVFDLGDGVRLDVLWPSEEPAGGNPNNGALVLRLTWRDVSFLLTGDIEAEAEGALLAAGADLRATVLKVAHHGSATSSTQAFLDAAQPAIAVVSAGRDNRFGHPAPSIAARLRARADLYTTAEHGAVHFETDGTRLWIDTAR